jgi:hypothetical protein
MNLEGVKKVTAQETLRMSRMDEHTLCIYSCALSEKSILHHIMSKLKEYEEKENKKIKSSIILNVIKDRQGIPYGYGYAYVSNSRLYHLLLGNNEDGTERKEIIDKTIPNFKGISRFNTQINNKSNILIDLFTDSEWTEKIKDWSVYSTSIYEGNKSPLIDINNPVLYDNKEKEMLQRFKQRALNKGKTLEELDYVHEEYAVVECAPAIVKDVDVTLVPHQLFCPIVPDWITEKKIHARISNFLHGKRNLRKKGPPYPLVKIDPVKRTCFVEFDSNTKDAQFILLMIKTMSFTHPKKGTEHVLHFTHMKKHYNFSGNKSKNPNKKFSGNENQNGFTSNKKSSKRKSRKNFRGRW